MGQSLLLSIAAAAIITTGIMSQISSTTLEAQQSTQADASKMLAREVAFTGLSAAKQLVLSEYDENDSYSGPTNISGDYNYGQYTVDITVVDTQVVFKASGQFNDMKHTIVQTFKTDKGDGIPPYFENTITCAENMNINSGITLSTLDPNVNASLFSNGNLSLDKSSLIQGFGYFGASASFDESLAKTIFQPNQNPNSLPVIQQIDFLNIPFLKPATFKHLATKTTVGDVRLSGGYTLGTKDEPEIWYIDGNLSTSGDVQFYGYGVVLVSGKANIGDDFVGDYASGESALALYVGEGISVTGQVEKVTGQWFSNGSTSISGDVHFYGSMTMGSQNCNFAKSFDMTYIPASVELTEHFWGGDGMVMTATQEW